MPASKPVERRDLSHAHLPAVLQGEIVLDDEVPAERVPAKREVPLPPELADLSPRLQEVWGKMWAAPVAQLWDADSDVMVLVRLFRLYREDERLSRALDLHMEHFMFNLENDLDRAPEYAAERSRFEIPIFMARMRVATECRMLEQQLGLTPKARLALGVALFVAGQSMSDHINSAMNPDG